MPPGVSSAAPSGGATSRIAAFGYARSISSRRAQRLVLFTTGYLVVWASAGVVAFGLGALIARLAASDPALGIGAGVVAYVGCGL